MPELEPVDAPPGVEITELRSATSQTYPPGGWLATSASIYSRPAFYQPEGATEWRRIDVGFDAADREGGLTSDRATTTVEVRDTDDPAGFLSVEHGPGRCGSRCPTPSPTRALQPVTGPDGATPSTSTSTRRRGPARLPAGLAGPRRSSCCRTPVNGASPTSSRRPVSRSRPQDDGAIAFIDADGATQGLVPRPFASTRPHRGPRLRPLQRGRRARARAARRALGGQHRRG